jgi:hypothetical protein
MSRFGALESLVQDAQRIEGIQEIYASADSENDAFEEFNHLGLDDPDDISRVLGRTVGIAYANWIYLNLK